MVELRCGVLPIRIQTVVDLIIFVTGKYRKLTPEERFCQLCNLNETENEIHFFSIFNL